MDKLGVLIPVRMSSERLPGKALKMISGKPIVVHLLQRICMSKYVDKENVVVCTTEDVSDDTLVETVEAFGAGVFRGSRDDIIKRFYDAMELFGFNAVSQVDGDDPLCDTVYMDLTMEKLLSDSAADIVSTDGLPLGMNSKSFTWDAMKKVFKHYKTKMNDTGFIDFFTKTGLCRHKKIGPLKEEHMLDQARLTLDYQEDLEVFEKIFENLYVEGEVFNLDAILDFLRENPEVMKINSIVSQEYWKRHGEKSQLYYQNESGAMQKI